MSANSKNSINLYIASWRGMLSILIILNLISGCGWHLAGTQHNIEPSQAIASVNLVKNVSNRSLQLALEEEFAVQGITISDSSTLTLAITNLRLERRPYAFSSTGNPVQYQLEVHVDYYFQPSDQKTLPEPRTITSRRQYDFEASAVIAKKQEEDMLLEEMHREIARRLIALARQVT